MTPFPTQPPVLASTSTRDSETIVSLLVLVAVGHKNLSAGKRSLSYEVFALLQTVMCPKVDNMEAAERVSYAEK